MAECILPPELEPAFLSATTGTGRCLHDTRLCRVLIPDTDQSCQIELGDNQDTARLRENHPRRMFCFRSKVVNYIDPQLGQNLAGDDSAGCVFIRQKDAASLYFDNDPSCVRWHLYIGEWSAKRAQPHLDINRRDNGHTVLSSAQLHPTQSRPGGLSYNKQDGNISVLQFHKWLDAMHLFLFWTLDHSFFFAVYIGPCHLNPNFIFCYFRLFWKHHLISININPVIPRVSTLSHKM